eukprot:2607238-Amphidinium_carterae.1
MKTVRALITLDAKLRKFLREDSKDTAKIRASLVACMTRWHMAVPEESGSQVTGNPPNSSQGGSARRRAQTQEAPSRRRSDDGGWHEVQKKKKKKKKNNKAQQEVDPTITLCQTAWSVPVRSERDFKLDTAAVYQVSSKDRLQHMALEAIHANFAVMAVSPFRTSLGFAPPEQMVLPFVLGEGASRSKAHLNVWVHQLSSDTLVPISPPDVINVSISGTESSSCVLSASLDVMNFAPEDISEALAKPAKARVLVASLLPRALAEDPLMDIFRLTRISGRWMSALFRVKLSAAEAYLKISGMGAVWVNTPKHLVDDTRLIWLRDPADPSSP